MWDESSNNEMLIRQIKTAQKALGRRHRLIDESVNLLDLLEPQRCTKQIDQIHWEIWDLLFMNQYADKELETQRRCWMYGCMDGELRTKPLDLNQDVYDRIKKPKKGLWKTM